MNINFLREKALQACCRAYCDFEDSEELRRVGTYDLACAVADRALNYMDDATKLYWFTLTAEQTTEMARSIL
jgi:hypothetical protein